MSSEKISTKKLNKFYRLKKKRFHIRSPILGLAMFCVILACQNLPLATDSSPLVYRGEKAENSSDPAAQDNGFVVRVINRGSRFQSPNGCSGVLIAPHVVATAAHCFGLPEVSNWTEKEYISVIFRSKGDERLVQVSAVWIHPDYQIAGGDCHRTPYRNHQRPCLAKGQS